MLHEVERLFKEDRFFCHQHTILDSHVDQFCAIMVYQHLQLRSFAQVLKTWHHKGMIVNLPVEQFHIGFLVFLIFIRLYSFDSLTLSLTSFVDQFHKEIKFNATKRYMMQFPFRLLFKLIKCVLASLFTHKHTIHVHIMCTHLMSKPFSL